MKKNLFEMGAKIEAGWEADNKAAAPTRAVDSEPPEKHRLYVKKEKRRGKHVTIIGPFKLAESELEALVKKLRKKLGTGGTVKEDTIQLQGDVENEVRSALEAMHYRFRV
jgi:translation initiation factor 1